MSVASLKSPTQLSRAMSSGSFTPGRDSARLKASTVNGPAEWYSEANPLYERVPAGPPHVGKRDELLKVNKTLDKKNLELSVALQAMEIKVANIQADREAERAQWAAENRGLADLVASLRTELAGTRSEADKEKAQLELELQTVQDELHACSQRLAKTHEALGITAEKAALLERSQGRLQIDLHGTLSTLEEASRRHREEKKQSDSSFQAREGSLLDDLESKQDQVAGLTKQLGASQGEVQRLQLALAKSEVDADTMKLHLSHEIERLCERVEMAEARRLDPKVLSNLKFSSSLLVAPPRGRLQQTVPPTFAQMASPAPN